MFIYTYIDLTSISCSYWCKGKVKISPSDHYCWKTNISGPSPKMLTNVSCSTSKLDQLKHMVTCTKAASTCVCVVLGFLSLPKATATNEMKSGDDKLKSRCRKYCSFMTDKLPQPKCEVSYHKSENYWISSLTIVEIHQLLKALLELLCSFSTDMDLADHFPQSLEDLEGL